MNAADPNVDQVFASYVNPNDGSSPVVGGHLQTDDTGLLWLQDQSRANVAGVIAQLTNPAHQAAMFADVLPPGTIFSGNVNFGHELAEIFGDPTSGDPIAAARAPNVVIQPNWGVIYSGSTKKISEHGGGTLDDTTVALLVSQPGLRRRVDHQPRLDQAGRADDSARARPGSARARGGRQGGHDRAAGTQAVATPQRVATASRTRGLALPYARFALAAAA